MIFLITQLAMLLIAIFLLGFIGSITFYVVTTFLHPFAKAVLHTYLPPILHPYIGLIDLLLDFLILPVTLCITFATFFVIFFSFLIIINKIARWRLKEKTGVLNGRDMIWWVLAITSADICHTMLGNWFIHSPFPKRFYHALGLKASKNVGLVGRIWDPELVDIGENVIIGTQSIVTGHAISRYGQNYRQKIKIGDNCLIGMQCTILPGVVIEDNVMLMPNSCVPINQRLESGWLYGGVPAKKIRPVSKPKKQDDSSEDESATSL
ncbi:MAG: DapH/DapD/GlmU-related protein [Promethearchaeota archaeon]